MHNKTQRGFTLIELVLVIMILGIIAAISSKTLSQGFSAYLAGRYVIEADGQARLALERMAREIHVIRSPTDISTATASPGQLTFNDINGNNITYNLSGSSLMRNSQILADGINSLTFSFFDVNGASTATPSLIRFITIALNVTLNNTNFTITTSVFPRDLP